MIKWISIEDRLPEENIKVLFYNVFRDLDDPNKPLQEIIQIGFYKDGAWQNICYDYDDLTHVFGDVTHWQPLPDRPNGRKVPPRPKPIVEIGLIEK